MTHRKGPVPLEKTSIAATLNVFRVLFFLALLVAPRSVRAENTAASISVGTDPTVIAVNPVTNIVYTS